MAKEPLTVQAELEALQLEETRLRVEQMRESVAQSKQQKENQRLTSAQQENMYISAEQNARQIQAECPHRKGGTDKEGLQNGNDSQYSIIGHIMPNNKLWLNCTRCNMEWWPGTTKEHLYGMDGKVILDRKGKPLTNHTGYSHAEVARWPTGNSISAGVTYKFEKIEEAIA